MNKPISMVIKDTKMKLAKVCNESCLSPVILDLIVQGIYSEIHSLAEKQAYEEELAYIEFVKSKNVGDIDESK
jgi:hypothetical protein